MIKILSLLIGLTSGFLILLPDAFETRILAQDSDVAGVPGESQYDLFITLFAAVLSGGGITVAGSFLATFYANKRAMNQDLRNKRIEVYTGLWKSTKSWAEYYRVEPKHYVNAEILLTNLHDWYFDGGGMYLSNTNRDLLFKLKKLLIPFVNEIKKGKDKNAPLQQLDIDRIIQQCHELRTNLSIELGVRKDILF